MSDRADLCPFCETQAVSLDDERADRWFEAGHLCREHSRRACLPDGRGLDAYVNSASVQLEGSLLGHVLNPLTVDGRRAWSMWVGGGYGVWGELLPSRNLSEFHAQHLPEGQQVLHDLHVHRELFGTQVTIHGLYQYGLAVRDRKEWYMALHRACEDSRASDRYADLRAAFATRLPPPAALLDAMMAAPRPEEPMPNEEFFRRVQALLDLARRRFGSGRQAHLEGRIVRRPDP